MPDARDPEEDLSGRLHHQLRYSDHSNSEACLEHLRPRLVVGLSLGRRLAVQSEGGITAHYVVQPGRTSPVS